jgi:hypothetical protein
VTEERYHALLAFLLVVLFALEKDDSSLAYVTGNTYLIILILYNQAA